MIIIIILSLVFFFSFPESIIGELQDRDVEAEEEALLVVSEGSQLLADEGLPKEKWLVWLCT